MLNHVSSSSSPSVMSIKKAMQTYARQGGSSSIFIHDDGLQIMSEAERQERIRFYEDNGIGWVARPKHENASDGFKRRGRFKKASNMNYGLSLSLKMEEHIQRLELERGEKRSLTDSTISDDVGDDLEERALQLAIEEIYEESGRRFKPWANNARALRIGDYILIVDADTIVPEVGLSHVFHALVLILMFCHRTVSVMPLASLLNVLKWQSFSMSQVSSSAFFLVINVLIPAVDVMQVANHYFENGIAHFTRRINKCISMACANGEVAPFVGHNAFLRWAALQDAAFIDPEVNKKLIWSEANVSEDFDMALRLMVCCISARVQFQYLMAAHSFADTPFGGLRTRRVTSRRVSR